MMQLTSECCRLYSADRVEAEIVLLILFSDVISTWNEDVTLLIPKYRLSKSACIPLYPHHYIMVLLQADFSYFFFHNYELAKLKITTRAHN